MKIYTKTGDGGETSLFGGGRVPKDDARVEAYGAVDELNAALGVVRALAPVPEIDAELARIQAELFAVGAELATPDRRPRPRDASPASGASGPRRSSGRWTAGMRSSRP